MILGMTLGMGGLSILGLTMLTPATRTVSFLLFFLATPHFFLFFFLGILAPDLLAVSNAAATACF